VKSSIQLATIFWHSLWCKEYLMKNMFKMKGKLYTGTTKENIGKKW
jgi:hypothetical protein